MPKIRVTPAALNDLKEIKSYIENDLANPIAANNVVKRIIKDYSLLETSPHMGPVLSAKIHIETDFRFIVSGNYIVFYKVDETYVSTFRIFLNRLCRQSQRQCLPIRVIPFEFRHRRKQMRGQAFLRGLPLCDKG